MFKYFNRKIVYKILLRLILVLVLCFQFILLSLSANPLTGGFITPYKLYVVAAFVCVIESIWIFFNLRFEIVSRFILTVLIGLSLILYGYTIPVHLVIYIIIFEIILLISIIYYIKKHIYKNITLNNIEDCILKIDYQFYILILLILLCIAYPYIPSEHPLQPDAEVTFSEASNPINNTTDVMVTVNSMNNADYLIVKESNEDHIVYTYWADLRPNQVDYTSATLISPEDNAIVQNLDKGDTVQVYAALDGIVTLIKEYQVR